MQRSLSLPLPLLLWLLVGATWGMTLVGCRVNPRAGIDAVEIVGKGVVNDPANKTLRFDLIRFGLREFCEELLMVGAPIRNSDDEPVIGRYFAESCAAKSLDDRNRKTIIAQFSGRGYAYSAATGRLGFRASGLLELAPDFLIHESALYVYFRPIQVDTSDFELLMAERPLAQAVAEVASVDEKKVGQQIINAQLGRGFTVIRYDADGHTDFALGLIATGERPFRPFTVESSPQMTLANGRTELFPGQQDYIGKLAVEPGQSLTMTLLLEGTDGVDVALVPEQGGEEMTKNFVSHPGPVARSSTVFEVPLASGPPLRAVVPLPPGRYYLVLDHSSAWGKFTPKAGALPGRVDYLLQVGK